MRFSNILTRFREKIGLTKTEMASKIGVSLSYYSQLESAGEKPPTFDMVHKMAKILRLNDSERLSLMQAAFAERISEDESKYLTEIYKMKSSKISPEIASALSDPVALKALLAAHKSNNSLRDAISEMITCLPTISEAKRHALIALCKG